MSRHKWALALLALLVVAVLGTYLARDAWHRHEQRRFEQYLASPTANSGEVRFDIAPGATMLQVSETLGKSGVIDDVARFSNAAVRLGLDRQVKAGQYLVEPGLSHRGLVDKLASGDVVLERFAIIEGTRFALVLDQLAKAEHVKGTLSGMGPEQAWALVAPGSDLPPEGMLYPDTYLFGQGHEDVEILRESHARLNEVLAFEWDRRMPGLNLETPYEALILASIIEKETGIDGERGLVSSTFHNRLRIGMRLQSDPTVIYGLGDAFDGNLTRKHLETDSPYNTYTRAGLPPTPIAIASKASIIAALQPPESKYLYFVADGTGGHHFSKNLREHNNAVNRYQRNRK